MSNQLKRHDIEVCTPWKVRCIICKKEFHIYCRWDLEECLGKVVDMNKSENQAKIYVR